LPIDENGLYGFEYQLVFVVLVLTVDARRNVVFSPCCVIDNIRIEHKTLDAAV